MPLGAFDVEAVIGPGDPNAFDGGFGVHVEGGVFEDLSEDRAESTGSGFALDGLADDVLEEAGFDLEIDASEFELFLEGRDEVALEDQGEGVFIEGREGDDAFEACDQFGEEAVLLKVAGLFDFVLGVGDGDRVVGSERTLAGEAESGFAVEGLGDEFEAGEGTAGDEGDLGGGEHQELLVAGVGELGGDGDGGGFEEFEEFALDAEAGDIFGGSGTCEDGVVLAAGDLVELVEADDADLGERKGVFGGVEEAGEDRGDVLADVSGFGVVGDID